MFCGAWDAFSERFSNRISGREPSIYSLPVQLVESLRAKLPYWLTAQDLTFEEEFADLCGRYHVVGAAGGKSVPYGWLTIATPTEQPIESLTLSDLKLFEGDQFWTLETANCLLKAGADRIEPIRQQLQAFIGWLITNPAFVSQVAEFKAREKDKLAAGEPLEDDKELLLTFVEFCAEWQLDGMATWDLPIPCGVNLSGLAIPLGNRGEPINLTFPATVRLPARFPLGDLMKELRRDTLSDRLAGWREVLDPNGGDGKGLRRYRQILPLHFYRNVVLQSRYGDRILGHVELLDVAFADFFGDIGEDRVKKLRLGIERRFKGE
jgi:hypothetical protein